MSATIEANNDMQSSAQKETKSRKRLRLPGGRVVKIGAVVAGGILAANALSVGCEDFNPNPGQEPGRFEIDGAVIRKFAAQSSDAYGSAEIRVDKMTQQWIDKRDGSGDEEVNPHETMVLNGGVYKATWGVQGKWAPEESANNDLLVTLQDVKGIGLETLADPKINEDESGRAVWQAVAGFFGGDDTDDAIPRENARDALREWVDDAGKSGQFQKSVACVALAGAADKAAAVLGLVEADNKVNIQTYVPPRAEQTPHNPDFPTITFQIKDPTDNGRFLTIESCLPTLDGLGYSADAAGSNPDSAYGLATATIDQIVLPAIEQ